MSKEQKALTNLLESYSEGKESEANELNGKKPRNYWSKWSNLRKELREIIKHVRHFPSQKELAEIGLSSVSRAIAVHGGFVAVREKMGYKIIKRTTGHWKDFDNVKSTLEEIIEQIGDFPSSTQLKDLGYNGLITGIQEYHGGIRSVKEKMGYENETRPNGYWKDWKNVRTEINKLRNEFGHFPSSTELRENGHRGLEAGIKQYYGGITKVKKRLGIKDSKKQKGYWEKWRNIKKELEEAIEILGHFPTQKELIDLGKSSIGAAIGKYHSGMNVVREKMGYETERKTPGHWKDFKVIKTTLGKVISEIGEYPSQRYLLENGHGDLVGAIGKNHGGWSNVRSRLGYEASVKPKGFWTDWENVEEALKDLIERNGRFPTFIDFKNSEYATVPGAIKKFHGGMEKAYEKLGYEREYTPQGYWKEFENVEKTLVDLESELGHFPTQKEIYDSGYTGLPSAINNYHGGLHAIAKKLGKQTRQRTRGFWTLKRTKETCLEYMEEHGKFPTQQSLKGRDDKYQGLHGGINKHGGFARVKKLLKVKENSKPSGYWNENTIMQEVRKIVREHGYFPTQRELNEMGHSDLVGAIPRYTNFASIRRQLGLDVNKVENGFWSEDMILNQCRDIISECGDLPSKDGLKELGKSNLAAQIERNGGYPYFREKLGLDLRRRPNRFWTKDRTYEKAKELYQEYGRLPYEKELRENNLAIFPNVVREHFGGMNELRDLLKKEFGDDTEEKNLQRLSYIQEELKRIQSEHELQSIPGQGTLKKLGYDTLVSAIKRFHGGFNFVRESLGETTVSKNGTWQDPKYVLNEARKIMEEHDLDSFPSEAFLREHGYTMLPNAIRSCYGGMSKFRTVLGEKPMRRDNGQWKDLDYTISQALIAMEKLGYEQLPPQKILSDNGFGSLNGAISAYHGGIRVFRETINQHLGRENEGDKLENLLKDYVV